MITELEIINAMLASVGETAVLSESSTHPSAIQARALIARKNKEFQSTGWWFNREVNYTLAPDTNGHIILPSNVIEVAPARPDVTYVQRGLRLYDKDNSTYEIGVPVDVNMTVLLAVEELPIAAANYLEAACILAFYVNEEGDAGAKFQSYNIDLQRAYSILRKAHLVAEPVVSTRSITAQQLRLYGQRSTYNPARIGG